MGWGLGCRGCGVCGPRVAWVEMRIGAAWVRLRGEGGVGISGGREAAGLTGTEGPEV